MSWYSAYWWCRWYLEVCFQNPSGECCSPPWVCVASHPCQTAEPQADLPRNVCRQKVNRWRTIPWSLSLFNTLRDFCGSTYWNSIQSYCYDQVSGYHDAIPNFLAHNQGHQLLFALRSLVYHPIWSNPFKQPSLFPGHLHLQHGRSQHHLPGGSGCARAEAAEPWAWRWVWLVQRVQAPEHKEPG